MNKQVLRILEMHIIIYTQKTCIYLYIYSTHIMGTSDEVRVKRSLLSERSTRQRQ